MSYQRPAFWRLPRNDDGRGKFGVSRKKVHFNDGVQVGSPAYGELLRGDLITKLEDYDSRDLRHDDAQQIFRTAGNQIHVVVRRDNKIALNQNQSNGSLPVHNPTNSFTPVPNNEPHPHRAPSPLPPGPDFYKSAIGSPVNTLPHTSFPHLNESGGYVSAPIRPPSRASSCFSPMPTRDHQTEVAEETAAIVNQVRLYHYIRE